MKHILRKYRNSFIRKWLKYLGRPDYKFQAHLLGGGYLEPSEVIFPERYKVFYYGKYITETSPLSSLKHNAQSQLPVSIVGSGPSVSKLDLLKLRHTHCILLNGAISLIEQYDINPLCITIIDATFCRNRFELIRKIPTGSRLLLSFTALQQILAIDINELKRHEIFIADTSYLTEYEYLKPSFSVRQFGEIKHGFFDGGTVMATALQCAAALDLGSTVYLLGLDIGNARQPRFYEQSGKVLKSGLLADYETKICPFMQSAARYCTSKQINLYNCSPVSKLPYSIIPYSSFFESNKES